MRSNRRFGIELEFGDNDDCFLESELWKALKPAVEKASRLTGHPVGRNNPNHWVIKPEGCHQVEINTPALTKKTDAMAGLKHIENALKNLKTCPISQDCGQHVHLDITNEQDIHIKRLKLVIDMYYMDEYLFELVTPSRRDCDWCLPTRGFWEAFREEEGFFRGEECDSDDDECDCPSCRRCLKIRNGRLLGSDSELSRSGERIRYYFNDKETALSLWSNTVEFRLGGPTIKAEDAVMWALLCRRFVDVSFRNKRKILKANSFGQFMNVLGLDKTMRAWCLKRRRLLNGDWESKLGKHTFGHDKFERPWTNY